MNAKRAYLLANVSFLLMFFTILSLSIPVWLTEIMYEEEVTYGLFEICGPRACISYLHMPLFMKFVQALLILATIDLAFALVYCVLVAKKDIPAQGISILLALAGLFTFIAMVVYTCNNFHSINGSYGYSYYFGWTVYGLDMVFTLFSFYVAKDTGYSVIA